MRSMGKVMLVLETDRVVSVTIYLDEVLKQMKQNRHFAIKDYKIEWMEK